MIAYDVENISILSVLESRDASFLTEDNDLFTSLHKNFHRTAINCPFDLRTVTDSSDHYFHTFYNLARQS